MTLALLLWLAFMWCMRGMLVHAFLDAFDAWFGGSR